MLRLTVAETIQIFRRRLGLNQGALGAEAFGLSEESGRTKIKNIELGRQRPSRDELDQLAVALNVPSTALAGDGRGSAPPAEPEDGVFIPRRILAGLQDLAPYLDMLFKAVLIQDRELIQHIAVRIAALVADTVPPQCVETT